MGRAQVGPQTISSWGTVLFIGHTRFSLFSPDSVAWRASNGSRFDSVTEYTEYLFADARLAPRFDIFLNYSLPLLAEAAEGFNVRHIVSYAQELPAKWEEHLILAAENYPFLILDKNTDGASTASLRLIIQEGGVLPGGAFTTYRLDDDDLLPIDYFEQINPYVRAENAGMMVSLGEGVTALYFDGQFYNPRKCYAPMIAIGLASICRVNHDGSLTQPSNASHNMSDRSNPVVLDSRKVGFMWTRHPTQDSTLAWGDRARDDMHNVIRRYMDKDPAAAPDGKIEEAFPTMKERLHYQPGPEPALIP